MFKYFIIILVCFSICFYAPISATVPSDTHQCETLTSINMFQKGDSPETIKSKSMNRSFTEETNGAELTIIAIPTTKSSYSEYYRFKNNKLYEYVLKVNMPSVDILEKIFQKSSAMCGNSEIGLAEDSTIFTKQDDNGFYMTIAITQPPLDNFVLIIYGYKKAHSKIKSEWT